MVASASGGKMGKKWNDFFMSFRFLNYVGLLQLLTRLS